MKIKVSILFLIFFQLCSFSINAYDCAKQSVTLSYLKSKMVFSAKIKEVIYDEKRERPIKYVLEPIEIFKGTFQDTLYNNLIYSTIFLRDNDEVLIYGIVGKGKLIALMCSRTKRISYGKTELSKVVKRQIKRELKLLRLHRDYFGEKDFLYDYQLDIFQAKGELNPFRGKLKKEKLLFVAIVLGKDGVSDVQFLERTKKQNRQIVKQHIFKTKNEKNTKLGNQKLHLIRVFKVNKNKEVILVNI